MFGGELVQRVLVAALALPVVLACMARSDVSFAMLVLATTTLAATEHAGLTRTFESLQDRSWQAAAPMFAAYAAACATVFCSSPAVLGWPAILPLVVGDMIHQAVGSKPYTPRGPFHFFRWIALPLAVLQQIRHTSPTVAVYLVFGSWAVDAGCMGAGRCAGRTSLAPHVSPRKTWEGVAGGAVAALAWTRAFATTVPLHIAFILCIGAVCGDLIESALKSRYKDDGSATRHSGHIFGPHGGILDKIDSIVGVVYLFSMASHALAGGQLY
jgi:phosphatidate cytidylyltransferase